MKHIRVWGLLSVGALLLAGCRITLLPGGDDGDDTDPNEPAGVPLYETRADITITATVGATQAKVTATITDADDDNVTLETDQEVRVNGTALSGPNSFGDYTRTIPSAAEYTVTAVEPRKGQKDTLLVSPAQFEITSPLADQTVSLQGFELEWSDADNTSQVRIRLDQTLFSSKTRTFGPYTDTGTRTFDLDDLSGFVQGAPIKITLTKLRSKSEINGFDSGTAEVQLSTSIEVEPGS